MASVGMVIALIKALGGADPSAIEQAVSDWLDDHPEATTTVEDGSITVEKLASALAAEIAKISDKIDKPSTAGTNGQVLTSDGNGGQTWKTPSGGGGTSDYADLTNKPSLNGTTLSGNKTGADVGMIDAPSSPDTGDFLVYSGSAWVAQSLSTWQGGNY